MTNAPHYTTKQFNKMIAKIEADIEEVERLVNAAIDAELAVHAADVPLAIAQSISGVRAVFGERYPDPVRVVSIGAPVDTLHRCEQCLR